MNELQQKILGVYKEVARICDKNEIRYFAIGGTAIGAVRHKGFIPWDDDLDIAVPIEDYDRLLLLLETELDDGFRLVSDKISPHYANVQVKVDDVHTTQIESWVRSWPDRYTGAWVDIMPMGGAPTASFLQKIYSFRIRYLYSMNAKARMPYVGQGGLVGLRGKFMAAVARAGRKLYGIDWYRERWDRLMRKRHFYESDFIAFSFSNLLPQEIFPSSWFSDYVLMPFEDTQMRMPSGWHEYLTKRFGDYMQLPPLEERKTHRCFVDLNHSFYDYQSGKIAIPDDFFDKKEING